MLTPDHPTECRQARDAASARLDGLLPELDTARLDAHLGACVDCRAYAGELAAVAALLRAAPLEQPGTALFVPRRRRPVVRVQTAAAAVVLLAAATGSSFVLGLAIGGHGPTSPTATGPAEILTLRADSTRQHLLAMVGRLRPVGSLHVGKAIAL